MNAQRTAEVGFGMVFRFELIRGKEFWIVLLCVCRNGHRIQSDEGIVYNAQLREFPHRLHDALQFPIVQFFEETVIFQYDGRDSMILKPQ